MVTHAASGRTSSWPRIADCTPRCVRRAEGRKWGEVFASLALGMVLFRVSYPLLGSLAGGAALLPGLLAAHRLGPGATVLVSLLSCVAMNVVLVVSGLPLWSPLVMVSGTACLVGAALFVARHRTLQERLVVAEREAQLAAARAGLASAERLVSLGTLAAGVAHEVNNPLAYLIANLRFVREVVEARDLDELPEAARALAECEVGAERVRSIVQDMKRLARDGLHDQSTVAVADAVRSAVNLVPQSARTAEVTVAMSGALFIRGSDSRLVQVVLNLVMNALQAFSTARPENRVRVRAEVAAGGQVCISVEDNGPGIAPEVQPRIFDPFFTTKPPGVGTGLGLPLCQSYVTSMGGTLQFRTSPGAGTTFEVYLPAASGGA